MNEETAVAVVGIGCRFPGANSPEEFWRVLVNSENHVKEVPPDRWNVDSYYSSDKGAPGKTYAKHAGLIDDMLKWDNKVFGINQMEAETIDPQQKLALEVSFRALEDSGISMRNLKGSNTAVYMGTMTNDYSGLCGGDENFTHNYSPTGLANSVLANRVSYYFDIHGPSITLDTACSSGMMCLHLGSASILSGESSMAICGGVGCILSPMQFISLSKARMASEKGQCHTYTENADGYARSEGCGVVILKNLQMAQKDGDRIYGIVTTAVNSDGKAANPMTAPSSYIQAKLIQDTLSRAHLQAELIQFVEMHGTGTPVGDPIEVSSVGSVYGATRKTLKQDPCPVGSVKTNVGHLEAAAGIAGLLKVLLMMQHETMVPSVIFGKLKEALNLVENNVEVLRNKRVWKVIKVKGENIRLASVNSFGFGGTNVHCIVQSMAVAKPDASKHKNESKLAQFVLFTGADSTSTKASMSDTLMFLETKKNVTLDDLAYTSVCRRSLFKHRVALSATTLQDLKNKMQSALKQDSEIGRRVIGKEKNQVVFVFCGMGTHWPNMGMQLYEQEPMYRKIIDRLHDLFASFSGFDLKQCIVGKYDLSDPTYGQPSIFACQVALFELWRSKGVCPNVIVGHSVGEVAAAYASGKLDLESAAFVIYYRGRIVGKATDGTMMAVGKLPIKEMLNYMKPYEDKLCIAAYNSHQSCTISGAAEEMTKLQNQLEALETKPFIRRLAVKVAYHSMFMEPVLTELGEVLQTKPLVSDQNCTSIRHISTVTGKDVIESQLQNPDYWKQNVRKSVRFSDAFTLALASDKMNVVVEIGPKPALRSNIKEIASSLKYEHLPSIAENKEDTFYHSLRGAFELEIVSSTNIKGRFVRVPRYVFDKQVLYKEPEKATAFRKGENNGPKGGHPFVFKNVQDEESSTDYQCVVSPVTTAFVYEHTVSDTIVVPGATYVEMGLASLTTMKGLQLGIDDQVHVSAKVTFNQVCYLKNAESTAVLKVVCHPEEENTLHFNFDVTSGETLHAFGRICVRNRSKRKPHILDLTRLGKHHTVIIKENELYDTLQNYKFAYGPSLRGVKQISTDYKDAIIKLEIPENADLLNTIIHPAILDSLLQSGVIFPSQISTSIEGQVMPYGIDEIEVYGKFCRHMVVYMELMQSSPWKLNATICSTDGIILAECKGITYGVIGTHLNFDTEQCVFLSTWKEIEKIEITDESEAKNGRLLIVYDERCTFPMASLSMPSVKVKLTNTLINDVIDDEHKLDGLLPKDIGNFNAIIFLVGLHKKAKDIYSYSGDQMNDFVLETNMTLIQLVKIANKSGAFPLIYVITRGVYPLLDKQVWPASHTLSSLIGTTTTAMCRTIVKELDALELCTIDTQTVTKQDIALIDKIVSNRFNHYEVSVADGKVRYGTIVPAGGINDGQRSRKMKTKLTHETVQMKRQSSEKQELCLETLHHEKIHRQDSMQVALEMVLIDPKCQLSGNISNHKNTVTQYDSIGKTNDGQKYHICQNHTLSSTLGANKANTLRWDEFPSKYPCLSFWLLTWNTLKKIQENGRFQLLIEDVSPIWTLVVCLLGELMGLTVATNDESCTNMVMIVKQLSDDLLDTIASNKRLLVISETYSVVTGANESKIHYLSIAPPLISPHKITKLLRNFQSWLPAVSQKKREKAIKKFDNEVSKCSTVVKLPDFSGAIVPSLLRPTFLSVEQVDKTINVLASRPQQIIKRDGGYIVIGGRKGLGWETIKHLITLGAKFIGVVSRSPPREEMLIEGYQLEKEYKCKIIDLQADTSNIKQLGNALKQFEQLSSVSIKGIFYGAAVVVDSIIPFMTKEKFTQVLTPKVAGVWNLYILTRNMDLDMFVMYSSITSMYGNPGQTNYGAGNGFKDAVACLKRIEHGVGQSICFGALDIGIVADNVTARNKLLSMGFNPMKVPEILACLDHALLVNQPLVCYNKFIWRSWYRTSAFRSYVPKLYGSLIQRYCHYMKAQKKPIRGLHLVGNDVGAYVVKVIQAVALLSDEDITMDATLGDLGVDSQDMQQIYSVLREDIGFKESDINLMEVGGMVLKEFISVISKARDVQNDGHSKLATQGSGSEKTEFDPSAATFNPEETVKQTTQENHETNKSEIATVEKIEQNKATTAETSGTITNSSASEIQNARRSKTCVLL